MRNIFGNMLFKSDMLTRIKEFVFPIQRNEITKFLLLSSLCFIFCMNYTILRNTKETLVITHPDMGIYAVPFIRTWLLMPLMLIFVKLYAWLSTRYSQPNVCYILITLFLVYFMVFIYGLYPYENALRPEKFARWVDSLHPILIPMGKIIRYWSFSIFYSLAEVWGTIVVLILFWGTSNRSTTLEQAKRFYSPILLITNLSGIASSQISLFFSASTFKNVLFPNVDEWNATFCSLTLFVCITTVFALGLLVILYRRKNYNKDTASHAPRELGKDEMSLIKMLQLMINNRKFWPLAGMVFAYFFVTGIMEFLWKMNLHKLYPNANEFNDYLNYTTNYIGIVSTLLALFVTGNLIRRFSWRVTALVTPIALLIPLILMLIAFFFNNSTSFLQISVILGALYYGMNRICKFTFFDLSKEVASVDFAYDEQIKSKSVLDGMLPKFGKTSESIFLQILLLFAISADVMIPLILFAMLAIHVAWAFFIPISNQQKLAKINTQANI